MLLYPDKFYFYCDALPKQKKNDASRRKALLREFVCVWVDVWPLSLASSLAPHVSHSLGPNVDQDRKTIKKNSFITIYTDTTHKM